MSRIQLPLNPYDGQRHPEVGYIEDKFYKWDDTEKVWNVYYAVSSGGEGTTVHNELTGRDADDAHPISAIAGLSGALDGKQPAGSYAAAVHGHVIGDVTGLQGALDGKQPNRISFRTKIATATANVVADIMDKWTDVDFATTVTITIPENTVDVGSVSTFRQIGAGVMAFAVSNGTTQAITATNKSSESAKIVQLVRLPDIASVEQYEVIGGVA
jgi:hypothetical protein